MTNDDALFGYRLQLFDLGARTTVTNACRTFGCFAPPTTAGSARSRPRALRCAPRERRRPQIPNASHASSRSRSSPSRSPIRPRPTSARRQLERHSGLRPRQTGSGRCFAATGCPPAPSAGPGGRLPSALSAAARARARAQGRSSRPGELVGFRLLLRPAPSRHPGCRLAAARLRHLVVLGWAEPFAPLWAARPGPDLPLCRACRRDLARVGWRLERVVTDNGNEFNRPASPPRSARSGRPRPGSSRASAAQRPRRAPAPTILEECWARPSPATCRSAPRPQARAQHLHAHLDFERAHTGRNAPGSPPATSSTVLEEGGEMSQGLGTSRSLFTSG